MGLEDAEKQQLVNEEEVSALQRRFSLLDDDIARSDGRLQGKRGWIMRDIAVSWIWKWNVLNSRSDVPT